MFWTLMIAIIASVTGYAPDFCGFNDKDHTIVCGYYDVEDYFEAKEAKARYDKQNEERLEKSANW